MNRWPLAAIPAASLVLLAACGGGGTGGPPDAPVAQPPAEIPPGEPVPGSVGADRPVLTAEECAAKGGSVVGDIGDGATHRPDYVCASGAAPIGNVQLGVEGSVCCAGGPAQGTSAPAP